MNATSPQPQLLRGPAGIVVNVRGRTVEVDGNPVELTRLAFDILVVLLERRGEVMTHAELAELAWGQPPTDHHVAIQTGVYRLRMALHDAGVTDLIRAIRGVGYTIAGPPGPASPLLESDALQAALVATHTPALLVEPSGRIALATESACNLTGRELAALQRLPSWLGLLAEGAWARAEPAVAAALEGDTPPLEDRIALRVLGGETRLVCLEARPIGSRSTIAGALVTLVPLASLGE
jgi:DNA-binding winged helix-turn-helix (wHTH) protein